MIIFYGYIHRVGILYFGLEGGDLLGRYNIAVCLGIHIVLIPLVGKQIVSRLVSLSAKLSILVADCMRGRLVSKYGTSKYRTSCVSMVR